MPVTTVARSADIIPQGAGKTQHFRQLPLQLHLGGDTSKLVGKSGFVLHGRRCSCCCSTAGGPAESEEPVTSAAAVSS
jgi:hypothetical protein